MNKLEELVPKYYENKKEMDNLKKICDADNLTIKGLMLEEGLDTYKVDDIVAKYIVAKKENFNEVKLLQVLKAHGYLDCIKTKEYVDIEALENALYHSEIDADTIVEMEKCKEVKEIIQLRVSKKKEK